MFDLEIYEIVNILGLIIGIAFGIIAQKKISFVLVVQ